MGEDGNPIIRENAENPRIREKEKRTRGREGEEDEGIRESERTRRGRESENVGGRECKRMTRRCTGVSKMAMSP
jgi:hypothetical protein